MDLVVEETQDISGAVKPSPSKFHTQFATALAFLSEGKSVINSPLRVDDTRILARSIRDMGATVNRTKKKWTIWGLEKSQNPSGHVFDAKNSRMCLSLMTALSTFSNKIMIVTAGDRLRKTPVPSLINSLSHLGIEVHSTKEDDTPPLVIFKSSPKGGKLDFGVSMDPFYFPANILAMSRAQEEVELILNPDIRGRFFNSSIELIGNAFNGVSVTQRRLRVSPGDFNPFEVTITPDIFSTLPYVTAAILTKSKLRISSINNTGNICEFIHLLNKMGIDFEKTAGSINIKSSQEIKSRRIDLGEYYYLLPFFAVMATNSNGSTRFVNAGKARSMKSDRIKATVEGLKKMGAKVTEYEDGLKIKGPTNLKASTLDGYEDDIMVAALGVAGLKTEKTTIRNRAEALRESYPSFVTIFKNLGANMGYETRL